MRINELVEGIASMAEGSFTLLEMAENSVNWLLIGVGFIMMVIWVWRMGKYNQEAKANGTLK